MANQQQQQPQQNLQQKHKQAPRFTQEQMYLLELGKEYNEILIERNEIEERRMAHIEQVRLDGLKRVKVRKDFLLRLRVKGPLALIVAMGLTSFLAKTF